MALVDNHGIEKALIWGAGLLKNMILKSEVLRDDAPPAFLLDSNRMHRYKKDISVFDNSWDLYNQDIPSPEYFLKNGINRIVVRGDKINKDLSKILYSFQNKGVKILFTNGFEAPREVTLKKPQRGE